ncbi:MAG: nucleotidyl transferase AbiEii/AbiGii toxin family protein [Actinomycetota bacterium]
MPLFRDGPEFAATIEAAAGRLNISATAVEKDYWVSQVLRALAWRFHNDFVFKGGTSLSKAYRIIQRFSEDVDLLVLPGGRGRNATDTLMKQMGSFAAEQLGGPLNSGPAERGIHRSYRIGYPPIHPATNLFETSVLLEMGVRGGIHPCDQRMISSLLGDELTGAGVDLMGYSDLAPFSVLVLHPGRTLIEKLVLVNAEAERLAADDRAAPGRNIGRHFYDIHELLDNIDVQQLLSDGQEAARIVSDVQAISAQHFGIVAQMRPAGGFADSLAFDSATTVSGRLREAYESTMPELYFGSDALPRWDAICTRVTASRSQL